MRLATMSRLLFGAALIPSRGLLAQEAVPDTAPRPAAIAAGRGAVSGTASCAKRPRLGMSAAPNSSRDIVANRMGVNTIRNDPRRHKVTYHGSRGNPNGLDRN